VKKRLNRVKHLVRILRTDLLPNIVEQAKEYDENEEMMLETIESLEETVVQYTNWFVSGGGSLNTIEEAERFLRGS